MTATVDFRPAALDWLARLPLLGAYELSMLLNLRETLAAALLSQLEQDGWLESVRVSSPEFEPARLYALSNDGVLGLTDTLRSESEDCDALLRASRRELSGRLARVETTVSMNRFAAELVAAMKGEESVILEELRSLPSRRPRSAWWPSGVEAYGCLRAGSRYAPFFLAWDRAGAPAFHRRSRVSGWYAFRDRDQAWGQDFPCLLIVCPSARESAEWEWAVLAAADRRRGRPLPVLLAEVDAVFAADPLDAVWRRPGGSIEAPLVERLSWRWTLPALVRSPRLNLVAEAPRVAAASGQASRRGLGLSAGVDAAEKRILEWLAFHPLLTAAELAVLLRSRGKLCEALIAKLAEKCLVDSVERPVQDEAIAVPRYFLTAEGLKLLALRDGVPPRRYLRHTAVAAQAPGWPGGGRLQTLLRQFEHTVGVNRFFVRLVADATAHGAQVVRWLSASEAAVRFEVAGATHWLRPDGAADVYRDGKLYRVYLEWDRGTMRWPEMREKLWAIASYFWSSTTAQEEACGPPTMLIVTASPHRESLIWQKLTSDSANESLRAIRVFTSVLSLVERLGPWSEVWRGPVAQLRAGLTDAIRVPG